MAKRVEEFVEALEDEIKAGAKKNNYTIDLSNGKFVRYMAGHFCYEFCSSKEIRIDDGTNVTLEISGKRFDCVIVVAKEKTVEIAFAQNMGDSIFRATLKTGKKQILGLLIDRFKKLEAANPEGFLFAEKTFNGLRASLTSANLTPKYSFGNSCSPNESQSKAIDNSFRHSLAVIWGPPGTGKTRTIARAVEAHLRHGRRVLLVSHANAAVDAALEDIADQLADSFYKDGKIIRLGVPTEQSLEKRFPLVLTDTILQKNNSQLLLTLKSKQQSLAHIEATLEKYKPLVRVFGEIQKLEKSTAETQSEAQKKIDSLDIDIQSMNQRLRILNSAPTHFGAADRVNREKEMKDLRIRIASLSQIREDMSSALEKALSSKDKLNRLYDKRRHLLNKMELNPNWDVSENKKLVGLSDKLRLDLKELEARIAKTKATILSEAAVVATTVSTVYCKPFLDKQTFDVLIVDEASMVPMPALYFAISRTKAAVTIVGDFNQLPPIVQAETAVARKWLGRSIFDELKIGNVDAAQRSPLVSMLDTQYRMSPEIAELSSKLFYGGRLFSATTTKKLGLTDSIFGKNRLVLIDTSSVNPVCDSPNDQSRRNLYTAALCADLSERLLLEHSALSVGVATPYRVQADCIRKQISKFDTSKQILVDTVHRFQGGEAQVMIFDCVDGPGSKRSILNDPFDNSCAPGRVSQAEVMLNVALTRARSLFIMIVNCDHFLKKQPNSFFCRFIKDISQISLVMQSQDIADDFKIKTAACSAPSAFESKCSYHDEKDFWSEFLKDLKVAVRSVLVMRPFITTNRTTFFLPLFKEMIARGVSLKIYTKPVEEQDSMKHCAIEMIKLLSDIGAEVFQRPLMHQKVAMIDDQVLWDGSLNILSHRNTGEQMRRSDDSLIVEELRRMLGLE